MKNKRIIIILISIVVLVVGISVYLNATNKDSQQTYIRTTTLTKGSLESLISTTGVVSSTNQTAISSSITNVKVTDILVEVGDEVKKGETLIKLDQEKLNDQISDIKTSIKNAKASLQSEYDQALLSKDDAYQLVNGAGGTKENFTNAQNDLETVESAISSYQNKYDQANTAHKNNIQLLADAETILASTEVTDPNYSNLQTAVATAQSNLAISANALTDAEAALNDIKLTTGYDETLKVYNQAKSNYDETLNSYKIAESKYQQAKTNLSKNTNPEIETLNTQLESLEDSIENYTLKAESTGTVTSLNATIGATLPMGSTVATINDTESLQVKVQVSEDDIHSVKVGQKTNILSDATTEEITGTVTNKAPVATTTGQGATLSTFTVTVEIDTNDTGLLIGMNAQVDIILSSVEEVFIVPIDAVEVIDGKSYVYKQTTQGTNEDGFTSIEVTTGSSNDYYIEVTGLEIKEGLIIRSSANLEEAETDREFDMPFGPPSDVFGVI